MKALKDYKHNEKVMVKIFNPQKNEFEWVDGNVRGIVIDHTENSGNIVAVVVEFTRITTVETVARYIYIGDTAIFMDYESSYKEEKVREGFINPELVHPINKIYLKNNS